MDNLLYRSVILSVVFMAAPFCRIKVIGAGQSPTFLFPASSPDKRFYAVVVFRAGLFLSFITFSGDEAGQR